MKSKRGVPWTSALTISFVVFTITLCIRVVHTCRYSKYSSVFHVRKAPVKVLWLEYYRQPQMTCRLGLNWTICNYGATSSLWISYFGSNQINLWCNAVIRGLACVFSLCDNQMWTRILWDYNSPQSCHSCQTVCPLLIRKGWKYVCVCTCAYCI